MMTSNVFLDKELPPPKRRRNAANAHARYPDSFLTEEDAHRFLRDVIVPASQRWAYCFNYKSGSSSTMKFLFD